MPTVKTKQCEPKLFGSQARFVCEAKIAGDHTRYSCTPDSCMRKRGGGQIRTDTMADCQLTADTLRLQMQCVRNKEEILVQKKSSVIGGRRIFLTKMCLPPTARVSAETRDENL
jgi:hypothetical protein